MDQVQPYLNMIITPPYLYVAAGVAIILLLLVLTKLRRKKTAKKPVSMRDLYDDDKYIPPIPAAPKEDGKQKKHIAKVYMEFPPTEKMEIYSVNDGAPAFYTKHGKKGFLLSQGTSEIKAEYFWPRRGVLYKDEMPSSGIKRIIMVPLEGRTYYLSFNTEKETFIVS